MQGSEVARRIRGMVLEIESAHKRLGEQLSEAEAVVQELSNERTHSFSKLVEIYLPELGEDSHMLRDELPKMQDKIAAVLWEKEQETRRVEGEISTNRQSRKELEATLEETTSRLESKADEREVLHKQVDEKLKTLSEHEDLALQTRQTDMQLQQSRRRLDASLQEKNDKMPAYDNDPLFSYLLKRGYETDSYRSNFLTFRLDAWVARMISYREQQQHYRLLGEVPVVMQEEVAKTERLLQDIGGRLLALEERVADQIGLTKVMEEGELLYEKRLGHIDDLEELDGAFNVLVKRQQKLANHRGEYYAKAMEEYRMFLENQSTDRLKALARSTDTRSDDGLTLRIESMDQELRQKNEIIKHLMQEQEKKGTQLKELLQLEARFRQEDFDASNSSFDPGLDIGKVLSAILAGAYGLEKAMKLIRNFQRFQRIDYAQGAATLAEILITLARASQTSGSSRGGRGRRTQRQRRRSGRGFSGFGGGSSRTTGGFG